MHHHLSPLTATSGILERRDTHYSLQKINKERKKETKKKIIMVMSLQLSYPTNPTIPVVLPVTPVRRTRPSSQPARVRYHHHHRIGLIIPTVSTALSCVGSAAPVATETESEVLPAGLERESVPRHVAVIMDGNSRWAKSRGMPASAGHEAGSKTLKEMVKLSCKWGIKALTVYAFSSENWLRPKVEVEFLVMLFERVLKENIDVFLREGIRVCIIGDLSKLPKRLQKLATEVEESTRNNSRLDLIVAISYSGRSDIVQACRKIARKVEQGLIEAADITESLIAQELETNCSIEYPYPDLLIRTSGELRLSNFLLWESAYTELYFTDTHWPDFGETDYAEALLSFQRRQRRFGLRTAK